MKLQRLLLGRVRVRMRPAVIAAALVSLSLFSGLVIFVCHTDQLDTTDLETGLIELHRCPACYGTSLCPAFQRRHIQLTGLSRYSLAARYFNKKNVFFGKLRETAVVVKKLAHDSELAEVDHILCQEAHLPHSCPVQDAVRKIVVKLKRTEEDAVWDALLSIRSRLNNNDLLRCLSKRFVSSIMRGQVTGHLLYTLVVNPEPLIIQMFPGNRGWPFPTYMGACGRTITELYAGEPLANFENAPWVLRARLAVQLLQIAQKLTNNDLDFALYMTDVNMHNFVVSENNTVTLVDAEGFIVVDKQQVKFDKPLGWDKRHSNLEEMCHDCFSFSVEDLCSHTESDHNYYAICRSILAPGAYYSSPGFLHDIPAELDENTRTSIARWLWECAKPSKPDGRFVAVPQLISALQDALNAS